MKEAVELIQNLFLKALFFDSLRFYFKTGKGKKIHISLHGAVIINTVRDDKP